VQRGTALFILLELICVRWGMCSPLTIVPVEPVEFNVDERGLVLRQVTDK